MPSTVIRRFHYEGQRNELVIQFQSGRRYAYDNVPPEVYDALRAARSRGSYFNAWVRDRYPCRKLDEGEAR
jgi:KTSC domain